MQCTSHTERLQLAILDQTQGVGETRFLDANEKSFLDAMTKDERHRMFLLTDEEMGELNEATEDEPIRMPNSQPSAKEKRMRPFPLSEPVDHPMAPADILKGTVERYLSLSLSCINAAAAVLHSSGFH